MPSYGSDIRLHSWGSQEFKAGTWRREGRQRRNTAYWLAFPDSQPDFLYIPTHSHQSFGDEKCPVGILSPLKFGDLL